PAFVKLIRISDSMIGDKKYIARSSSIKCVNCSSLIVKTNDVASGNLNGPLNLGKVKLARPKLSRRTTKRRRNSPSLGNPSELTIIQTLDLVFQVLDL